MIRSGVRLNNRYEILERIGRGGMADVYRATDHKLNRPVAVKVLKKEYREDRSFVEKFQSEARAAAGLMHPNVVNVYDVGMYKGLWYMVMELVDGITLKDYIVKKGRLSWKEAVSVSIQVCSGIQAAHQKNIIHRDIKPQNIIISRDGKVKVTDFGIARATTSQTTTTAMMGSVHYTAPEQARRGMSDRRSDIYSMGIAMYEMVTGHVPFDGDSVVTVALKHIREDIVPPSAYVDIPNSLNQIILKATQKNPDFRYQDMDEMLLDLKHCLLDPEGDFVRFAPGAGGVYAVMSTQEVAEMEEEERHYTQSRRFDDDTDELPPDPDDGDEIDSGIKSTNKVLLGVIIAIIAAIAIFAIGSATGLFKFAGSGKKTEQSETVKVPDLVGMTKKEAETALKKKGLKLKIVAEEDSDKYDKGVVMKQKTSAGTKVPRGTTIQVIVCSGEDEEIMIPDVSGMTEDEARKKLKEAGFKKTDSDYEYSSEVEEGYVIATNPASGTSVPADTKVTVRVSKGTEGVIVPNLVGLTTDAADAALTNAGLTAAVTSAYSDTVAAGVVISQNPGSGAKVNPGSVVSYVVSKGAQNVSVPSLTGSTEAAAITALTTAGLKGNFLGYTPSSQERDTVVSQNPAAGQSVAPGTTISYYLSAGPNKPDQQDSGAGGNTNNTGN